MNLLYSLSIIFTIMFIGFFCGKKRVFTEPQVEGFELFLFKIALPAYLFTGVLNSNFNALINVQYIYSYLICFLIVAVITAAYFWKTNPIANICIKILASGYINTAIYSLPIITFLLGDPKAAILGNLIQIILIQTVFLTIMGFFKHREKSMFHRLFSTFKSPLVSMPILGIVLNSLDFHPSFVEAVTKDLGNGAAGMALFTFGLNLSNIKIKKENFNKDLVFVLFTKNIIHPTTAILVGAYIFNLNPYWLGALVIATSSPTAFVVYLMAKQLSLDTHFVRMTVAMTSVVSLLLLFFVVFILQYFT